MATMKVIKNVIIQKITANFSTCAYMDGDTNDNDDKTIDVDVTLT